MRVYMCDYRLSWQPGRQGLSRRDRQGVVARVGEEAYKGMGG